MSVQNMLHVFRTLSRSGSKLKAPEKDACLCPQKPTVLVLNVALIGCIFSLGALLALSISGAPALVPHVAFLLFLAIGLFFLINWYELTPMPKASTVHYSKCRYSKHSLHLSCCA